MPSKKQIIFLAGPTAIGKSAAALYLAKKINAEIISCDSMQIYKGMDILTSKPTVRSRKAIQHHLVGAISPVKEYDVSRYRKDALRITKDILKRNKVPLFAGGTGLYMTILVDGIFKAKPIPKNIRKQLYMDAQEFGSAHLHALLNKVDPLTAGMIHPNDTKRIIRALEVFRATGKPISELKKQRLGLADAYDVRIFCLDMERNQLYRRIEKRVDKMFAQGAVKEVKRLQKNKLSKTASFAIGLREIRDYIEGRLTLNDTKELIKKNTRNYAKRQLTWFRKDKRIKWILIKEADTPKAIANKLWKRLS